MFAQPNKFDSTASTPIRVLIAEDETAVRLGLEHCVHSWGWILVGSTSTGREAIRLGRETVPHLLLLNLRLEGPLDGVEVARSIRLANPEVAVAFLSAETDPKSVRRMHSIQGAVILPKPFDPARLRALVEQTPLPQSR